MYSSSPALSDFIKKPARLVPLLIMTAVMSSNVLSTQSAHGAAIELEACMQDGIVIKSLYRNLLNRTPDPAGANHWYKILGENHSVREIVAFVSESAEFRESIISPDLDMLAPERNLFALYQRILGRTATPQEIENQKQNFHPKHGTDALIFKLIESPIFRTKFGSNLIPGIERDLISLGYHLILERPVDDAGFSTYSRELARGTSYKSMIRSLLLSAEFEQRFVAPARVSQDSARQLIASLYTKLLQRDPDEGGLSHWTSLVSQGRPFSEIADGFLNSAEYQTKNSATMIPGKAGEMVSLVFRNFLKRTPENEGPFASMLRSGQSLNEVFRGVVFSDEYFESILIPIAREQGQTKLFTHITGVLQGDLKHPNAQKIWLGYLLQIDKYSRFAGDLVRSQEYSAKFGDHTVPHGQGEPAVRACFEESSSREQCGHDRSSCSIACNTRTSKTSITCDDWLSRVLLGNKPRCECVDSSISRDPTPSLPKDEHGRFLFGPSSCGEGLFLKSCVGKSIVDRTCCLTNTVTCKKFDRDDETPTAFCTL